MSKILKILLQSIGIVFEWILICLIFFVFAIRTSPFQTFVAKQATSFLSSELKTKVDVGRVDFIFFNKLVLDEVLVLDKAKDTLADLGSVYVTLKKIDLRHNRFDLQEVNLNKGNIKINCNKQGDFNFQFIADYFASTDTTKSKPVEVNFKKIKLSQIDFQFDDNRYKKEKFGLDYSHIKLHNLYLTTTKMKLMKSGGISAYINHLSFSEKSGLNVKSFSSSLTFDDHGIRAKYLKFVTLNTNLDISKLNLKVNSLADFSEFVDKVEFDVDINKSLISLEDVSIFATSLEGMTDKVFIQTKLSKRIKDLKIEDLDLRFGKKSVIQGTFNLPDFSNLDKNSFNESVKYAFIQFSDLTQIKLPKNSGNNYIKLDPTINKLRAVKIYDLAFEGGITDFVLKANHIKTAIGNVSFKEGIHIHESKTKDSYYFEKNSNSSYSIQIDSLLLGEILNNKDFRSISGKFSVEGELFNSGKIDFNLIEGELKRFDYLGYAYKNIGIANGEFKDNIFKGQLDVADDNLDLTYNGVLDFNTKQHFQFDIDITKAVLDKLHLTKVGNSNIKSSFTVDISGTNVNNYSGGITLSGLVYNQGNQKIEIPSLQVKMNRSELEDELYITSSLGNAYIKGKVDYETIALDITNQFSAILPAIFKEKKIKRKTSPSQFKYSLEIKQINEVLALFVPNLNIAPNTVFRGEYDGTKNIFSLDLTSSKVTYENYHIKDIVVKQLVSDKKLIADYTFGKINLNDSLFVNDTKFSAIGNKDEINSELSWNSNTESESHFSWKTIVNDVNSYFFNLNPSYFLIKGKRWDILYNSQILLAPNDIHIQNFKMERNQQYITIDGCISDNNQDILKLDIHDLQLEDFTSLFSLPINVKGQLNAVATISDPFKDIAFTSDLAVRDLKLNNAEVGDINLKGNWGVKTNSLDLSGELFYKKNKTFNFDGKYFLEREKNNLDFNLDFDYTDIQFANVFMDPQVVSGIRGLVNGKLKITGTPEVPAIAGSIDLLGGNAKVEMFGVNFGFNGSIDADQYGFYINNMPIMDEEGNSGALVGTVLHNQFKDWNMDLFFNLIDDAYAQSQGVQNKELESFLVMDTKYKEGAVYFGKAYATGTANIFGYANNLQIDVDVKTRKGTQINFPMYGVSDIEEGKFITFKSINNTANSKPKIDLTGVSMNLNFDVTDDAQMKIIFDESLGDEIVAEGSGDFTIGINNIGDVEMNGVYTIGDNSFYNFVYPPVNKKFIIKKGGTITWTGDVLGAKLDLKTYNEVTASLAEIMPNVEGSKSSEPKKVNCYLNLTETLLEPLITFDIDVPNANENDKAALTRVEADKDQLNKQFFSLLIFKKFQPLQGNASAGSGAALDIVSGQLEEILNNFSNDIRFNVNLGSAEQVVGFQKSLLNDKLIIKTNLGVENSSADGAQSQSSFVGDVNVEYLINEDGTFRVSIFNESNDNTVIQEKNLGLFTQGAGLNYQEEFNNFNDFKMVQYFLDLFRKQKKYPIKKKKKQTKVPMVQNTIVKPEEE